MTRLWRACVTAATAVLLATAVPGGSSSAAGPSSASARDTSITVQAGPSYRYCSKDTFTGWVRFWYAYRADRGVYYVGRIDFRIDASEANDQNSIDGAVGWTDPDNYGDRVSKVRQDGEWYTLDEAEQYLYKHPPGYSRNTGKTVTAGFSFHDNGQRHTCGVSWTM